MKQKCKPAVAVSHSQSLNCSPQPASKPLFLVLLERACSWGLDVSVTTLGVGYVGVQEWSQEFWLRTRKSNV